MAQRRVAPHGTLRFGARVVLDIWLFACFLCAWLTTEFKVKRPALETVMNFVPRKLVLLKHQVHYRLLPLAEKVTTGL